MIIQNNLMALNAQRQTQLNNQKLAGALEKLSSGYRINRAADDAAGLAISERMRAQQTGISRALMNAQDGVSLVQTAEGALTEVHSMLNRLTDLTGQAANGTLSDSQRSSINKEAGDILKEIDRISQATNFNGIKLLDGSLGGNQATSASVSGVRVDESAATAGEYAFAAQDSDFAGLKAGDEVTFTMGMNNGYANNVTFTVSDDLQTMTGSDGSTVALNGTVNGNTVDVRADVMMGAVADSMKAQSAGNNFTFVANADGAFTMTARDTGTSAPRVTSMNFDINGGQSQNVAMTTTPATDLTRNISKDSLTLFDGDNLSTAAFEVNGSKFVLVEDANYAETVAQLGDTDVTAIRVSGQNLSSDDLARVSADINHKTGMAFSVDDAGTGINVKAPTGGDGLTLQVGDTAAAFNQINVKVGDMSARGLGLENIDFSSAEAASSALSRINSAIEQVSSTRGTLGATQNRLESTIRNLETTHENITASESRIRDTDMAKMMMQFVRQNVLSQAGQAMMAQANLQSQQVLQLLR